MSAIFAFGWGPKESLHTYKKKAHISGKGARTSAKKSHTSGEKARTHRKKAHTSGKR